MFIVFRKFLRKSTAAERGRINGSYRLNIKNLISSCFKELMFLLLVLYSISIFAQEKRIIIAVVDTGIPSNIKYKKYFCHIGNKDYTARGIFDNHGHGTNVSGLIMNNINPNTHCIAMLKYWDTDENKSYFSFTEMFFNIYKDLLVLKPAYLNMSLEGYGFDRNEFKALVTLTEGGTKIIVASGNAGVDLTENCENFPACYKINKNFYVVGSKTTSGNYGGPVKYYENGLNRVGLFGAPMSGTSQATAIFTNKLIKGLFK